MIGRILAAIARLIKRAGRLTWNATKKVFDWTADRVEAVWDAVADTADAALQAPAGLLQRLGVGASGPAVQDPGMPAAPAHQERQAARQRTEQATGALDKALAVRIAARSLLRGEEPKGIPAAQAYWLRSMSVPELADFAALKPDEVVAVLSGKNVRNVAGYNADAWVSKTLVLNLRNDLVRRRFTMNQEIAPSAAPDTAAAAISQRMVPIDKAAQMARIRDFNARVSSNAVRPPHRNARVERKA